MKKTLINTNVHNVVEIKVDKSKQFKDGKFWTKEITIIDESGAEYCGHLILFAEQLRANKVLCFSDKGLSITIEQ